MNQDAEETWRMDSFQDEPSLSLQTELLEAPAWAAAGGPNGGAVPAPSLRQLPLGVARSWYRCSPGARADAAGRHRGQEVCVGQLCNFNVSENVIGHRRESGASGTVGFPVINGPIQSCVPCCTTREQGDI